MTDFVKHRAGAPAGFFAAEAAGLQWLSAVDGGVPCAEVVSVDEAALTLRRLESVSPTPEAAREFGGRLAITHDAGAPAFGAGPDGWDGPGFFGPLSQPLPMSLRRHRRWGSSTPRNGWSRWPISRPRGSMPPRATPSTPSRLVAARAISTTTIGRRGCTAICGAGT